MSDIISLEHCGEHALDHASEEQMHALLATTFHGPRTPWADLGAGARGGCYRADLAAPLYVCAGCTSTFEPAWHLHSAGLLPPWGAVLALRQTQGRGQLRREWFSPPGNLYVSFRLPEDVLFTHSAAAVLVGLLIRQHLAAWGADVSIKWPNDVVLMNAHSAALGKIAGILLEDKGPVSIAGVGINLLVPPSGTDMRPCTALPSVALAQAEGAQRPVKNPVEFWLSLCGSMQRYYKAQLCGRSWAECAALSEKHLLWRDRTVLLDDGGRCATGILRGLGKEGGVLLEGPSGECAEHTGGSLSLFQAALP